MAPKKKGPSLRTQQQRKAQMQKIAKGGPQLSGTKGISGGGAKPPSTPKAAPAGPSKPNGRQPRAITNGNSPAMRQIRAKAVQARRQAQGKSTVASRNTTVTPTNPRGERIRSMAKAQRIIGDSGQVRAAAKRGQEIRKAAQAARGAKQAMGRMGSTLARARLTRGPVSAAVGVAADATLSPLATKAGRALGERLKPLARKLDDALPGVNSKDEGRRRRAQAAAKGSTSRFKGAREAAVKKASAIKGSPVVGPRKASSGGSAASSFDSSFAAARKAGKSTFTWRGKKYNTKLRGE
jgi:hypothetical protein